MDCPKSPDCCHSEHISSRQQVKFPFGMSRKKRKIAKKKTHTQWHKTCRTCLKWVGKRKIDAIHRNKNVNDFVITSGRGSFLVSSEHWIQFHILSTLWMRECVRRNICIYICVCRSECLCVFYSSSLITCCWWFFCHRIESIFIYSRIHHKPQADSWLSC